MSVQMKMSTEAAQNLLTRLSPLLCPGSDLRDPGISGGVPYQWPEWTSRTRLRCLVCHDAGEKSILKVLPWEEEREKRNVRAGSRSGWTEDEGKERKERKERE